MSSDSLRGVGFFLRSIKAIAAHAIARMEFLLSHIVSNSTLYFHHDYKMENSFSFLPSVPSLANKDTCRSVDVRVGCLHLLGTF